MKYIFSREERTAVEDGQGGDSRQGAPALKTGRED